MTMKFCEIYSYLYIKDPIWTEIHQQNFAAYQMSSPYETN